MLAAAGGVGLAAVQIGKALGARVIAGVGSPDKFEVCRQNGADLTVSYRDPTYSLDRAREALASRNTYGKLLLKP